MNSEKYGWSGKDWRGYSINSGVFRILLLMDENHHRGMGVGSEILVLPDNVENDFWDENDASKK